MLSFWRGALFRFMSKKGDQIVCMMVCAFSLVTCILFFHKFASFRINGNNKVKQNEAKLQIQTTCTKIISC